MDLMNNSNIDDDDDLFFPLTPRTLSKILDSSNPIEFSDIAIPPTDFNDSDHVFVREFINNGFELSAPVTHPFSNKGNIYPIEVIPNESQNQKLQILAQPKASYRARYASEIDKEKNLAKRFIRAENNAEAYEYPTIKIPSWCNPNRQLYIGVTLVTVTNDEVPYRCIHPYAIDTPDQNVIRHQSTNSLFFRINEGEFITREKNFRIILIKKKQEELKSYGPMRLFDQGKNNRQELYKSPQDPKRRMKLYQLCQSQFVFTIAEREDNNFLPVPLWDTSVESQIMVDKATDARNSPIDHPNEAYIKEVICIPQKGDWGGGDKIVIIMPKPIEQKEYTICFDFREYGGEVTSINEIILIDTKTLLFQTPPCPFLQGDYDLKASIIIKENKSIISQIDFNYITPIKTVFNLCTRCQGNVISNKRRCEYDGGESFISQMNQLSIEQKPNESHSRITSEEKDFKLDKYLYQLKDALEIFLRKNDPSQLFRRTRMLLSTYDGNSSPLHDAIQHGHTQLALAFIKQIVNVPSLNKLLKNRNENGETPLLIAARLNQWKLIESILKPRSDLAKQKDKDGNNLFHLLANLSEDKGVETIQNVLAILSNELKVNLLKEKNKTNQKPMDIAQFHNNTSSLELLINIENNS